MQIIRAGQALTANGWERDVRIEIGADGRIERLTAGSSGTLTAECVDLDAVLPAPANLHSHAFQRAMAGLTEARGPDPHDSFWTWRRLMYRFLDRLTPDHVEAIAALVFMEMLEAGYGAVAEFHYLHHDAGGGTYDNPAEMAERIVAAAGQVGIGLTLLPVLYTYGGSDRRPLQGGQLRFKNDVDGFDRLQAASKGLIERGPEDYALGVAPHSLRAVDPEGVQHALALCPEGPVHMHLAEQTAEVDEVQAHLGARPTEWLLNHHDVDPRWCLIHATQMTNAETRALAATGAVAGLCPITESNLGDGIFNATTFREAGGQFGVGSDSNVHIALFEELATLDYSQRLRDRSRAALATAEQSTGRVLFENVASAGAQAAARDSGKIAVGQLADLVGVETDNPYLCDRQGDTLLDSLIFTGRGRDCITDVWSAGRHVVQSGRHTAREAVTSRYRAVMQHLGQDT